MDPKRVAMELLGALLSVPMSAADVTAATAAVTSAATTPPTTAAAAVAAIDPALMMTALKNRNIPFNPADIDAIIESFAALIYNGILMSAGPPPSGILNAIVAYVVPPGKP